MARALQEYGMILADGGNVAFTAQNDRSSVAKWADVLGARELQAIQPGDFDIVEGGTRFNFSSYDCIRNP